MDFPSWPKNRIDSGSKYFISVSTVFSRINEYIRTSGWTPFAVMEDLNSRDTCGLQVIFPWSWDLRHLERCSRTNVTVNAKTFADSRDCTLFFSVKTSFWFLFSLLFDQIFIPQEVFETYFKRGVTRKSPQVKHQKDDLDKRWLHTLNEDIWKKLTGKCEEC